jgi:hypothetical protein
MEWLWFVFCAAILVGCSSEPAAMASPSVPVGATIVPGGCGSTSILTSGIPPWLADVGVRNPAKYVLAKPPTIAGVLFVHPLRTGHPTNPSNKILWVVSEPRNGSALVITGHPLAAISPAIEYSVPPDSSPGEIYPSIVDVPTAGCWHFDLSWSTHHASLDLPYQG